MNSAYREEGILILSGGLTIHNLRDFTSFSEPSAKPIYKEFDKAVVAAADVKDVRSPLSTIAQQRLTRP